MSKKKWNLIIVMLIVIMLFAACAANGVKAMNTTAETSEPENTDMITSVAAALSLEEEVAKGIDLYANQMGVLEAIERRTGTRRFVDKDIPDDVIARLLWAAYGVTSREGNVTEHGLDAVSSATTKFRYSIPDVSSERFINIYLITPDGSYEYLPESQELKLLSNKNLMNVPSSSGSNIQCHILLSVDFDTYRNVREWAAFSVGTSAQNVYLYAASENIGVFAKGMFNNKEIGRELGLTENNEPYLLMSLGYLE